MTLVFTVWALRDLEGSSQKLYICLPGLLFFKFPKHSWILHSSSKYSLLLSQTECPRPPFCSLQVPFSMSTPPGYGSILTFQHLPNLPPCQSFNSNFPTKWSPGTLDSWFIILWPCITIIVNAYNLYRLPELFYAVMSPNYILSFSKRGIVSCVSHLPPWGLSAQEKCSE